MRMRYIVQASEGAVRRSLLCIILNRFAYSRTHIRVEPALYREVTVDGHGLFHRTVTASESTKRPDFFTTHVMSLFFEHGATSRPLHMSEILRRCSSVRSLAVRGPVQRRCPELHDTLLAPGLLRPTHLTLAKSLLGKANWAFTHPIFRSVTHLDLVCDSLAGTEWDWGSLRSLKTLSHLIVSFYFPITNLAPVAQVVLLHCPPSVRVLALAPRLWWELEDGEVEAMNWGEVDLRLVVVSEWPMHKAFVASLVEVGEGWGSPDATGDVLWGMAEEVVRVRRERAEGMWS